MLARLSFAALTLTLLFGSLAHSQSGTQTTCLQLLKPTPFATANQNTWGTSLNTDFDAIDSAVGGILTLSVAGSANVVLTSNTSGAADQARNQHFKFTGVLTGNINVLWPASLCRAFSVTNSTTGAFTLSIGVNNGGVPAGLTVTVPQGQSAYLISNGTDVTPTTQGSSGGTSGALWQSNGGTLPNWTTATYPATATINQLLYGSSANVVSGLSTANNAVLVTSAGGVPSISTTIPTATQLNITSLGTVTAGQVNATAGGTGVQSPTAHSMPVAEGASAFTFITDGGVAGRCIVSNGTGVDPSFQACPAASSGATVTLYTTHGSNTYNVPGSAHVVYVLVCGAGGGGGNGGSSSSGGGGGGSCNQGTFRATDLSSPVTVLIGTGGAGGTPTGGAGTDTTFGTYLTGYAGGGGRVNCIAGGGGGGGLLGDGGTTGSCGPFGAAGRLGGGQGNSGASNSNGADSSQGLAGGGGAGGSSSGVGFIGGFAGGCGGGGSGGITNSGSGQAGGAGGSTPFGAGGAGGTGGGGSGNGGPGGNGTPTVTNWFGPGGGGGGHSNNGNPGGAGGAGANCGGGGSGGNSSSGSTGAGGAGGDGFGLIVAW